MGSVCQCVLAGCASCEALNRSLFNLAIAANFHHAITVFNNHLLYLHPVINLKADRGFALPANVTFAHALFTFLHRAHLITVPPTASSASNFWHRWHLNIITIFRNSACSSFSSEPVLEHIQHHRAVPTEQNILCLSV